MSGDDDSWSTSLSLVTDEEQGGYHLRNQVSSGRIIVTDRPHTTHAIKWSLHAVLHGWLSAGSDTPASLIMMEVQVSGGGIRGVQFQMRFEACEPDEPDPEVVDIMPSEAWRLPQGSGLMGSSRHDVSDALQIIGLIQRSGKRHGLPDIASWQTNGDTVLRFLKPAVLLRRRGAGAFRASCKVKMHARHGFQTRFLSGNTATDGAILFNPSISSSDDWSAALENLQDFMNDIKKAGETSAAALMKMGDKSRRCLVALYTPTQQLYYVSSLEDKLLRGTNKWILEDKVFKPWLSPEDSRRALWIHGRAGVGKSMLATFLVKHLRQLASISEANPTSLLAYYFFVPGATQGIMAARVLRSLLHQLILQQPDMIKHLTQLYSQQDVGDRLFSDPSLLRDIVGQITADPAIKAVYLVVDGLEQCDAGLLDILQSLGSSPNSPDNSPRHKDKWILSSRNELAVELALSKFPAINLNLRSARDIEVYMQTGVQQLGLDPVSERLVLELLIDRAAGSFVWVKFALEVVKRYPGADMAILEKHVPRGLVAMLDQTLDDLLCSPLENSPEIITAVLPLLDISFEPLPVEVVRLLSESIERLKISQKDLGARLERALSPMVRLSSDTIQLSHASVKDYLANPACQKKLNRGPLSDLHKTVSIRCFQYICRAFADPVGADILEYPALFWMEHGRRSSQTVGDLVILLKDSSFLTEISGIRKRWFATYWKRRHGAAELEPTNFTMLHVAAEAGYAQLTEAMLSITNKADVNAVDGAENTPLHVAVRYGHCDVAQVLFERGANMHLQTGDKKSLLELAISNERKAMVQLLLEKGADFMTDLMSKARPDIKQLLVEHVQLTRKPRDDCKVVDHSFWGKVVDIGSSGAWYSKSVPVDRILASDSSFDELMADGRPDNISTAERAARWIHIPENNMEWIEILMDKVLDSPEAVANLLRSDLWKGRIRNADKATYARCLRPTKLERLTYLGAAQPASSESTNKRIMLVMPYLHWGTNFERLKLKKLVHLVNNGDNSQPGEPSLHTERYYGLLKGYLNRDHALHCRRTLDQFYYFNLDEKDMEKRDKSQTMSNYFLSHPENKKSDSAPKNSEDTSDFPILMVDQLWLWVVGDGTIISCFSHMWDKESRCDPYGMTNVAAAVERRFLTRQWPVTFGNGLVLAEMIVDECSGVLFDIAKYRSKWLQVREIYETAIGDVGNGESALFNGFTSAMKEAKKSDASTSGKERYSIASEISLLADIKDIRDELNIIQTIFQTQKGLLEEANLFKNLQGIIDGRTRDIQGIDKHASKIQEDVSKKAPSPISIEVDEVVIDIRADPTHSKP
ncbi:hypothetical protein S40288_10075 [Stachybotrys chartarum IBT 40288]|nr:hypothetical protein S40288_10075 [Stachybotrys chartarum IBT 40288]